MRYEEIITLEGVDIDITYDWIREDDCSYIEIVELFIGKQNVYDLLDYHHEDLKVLLFEKLQHDAEN